MKCTKGQIRKIGSYLAATALIVTGTLSGFPGEILVAQAAEKTYNVLTGDTATYEKGSNLSLTVTIDAPEEKFVGVYVDNQEVSTTAYTKTSVPAAPTETPTTKAPTTETPTTKAPTTKTPTTETPTTKAPTTKTPTTETPATEVPTTETPATEVPTSEAPAPTSEAPAPTSEAPVATSEAPVATSEAPVATSEAPVATSEAPVATSEAPVATSEAPVATSAAPIGKASVSRSIVGAILDVFSPMPVYAAENTNTQIAMQSSYLASLSAGTHQIVFEFTDGKAVLSLTVKEKADTVAQDNAGQTNTVNTDTSTSDSTTSPKTGDSDMNGIFGMLAIAAGLGIIYFERRRKNVA